MTIFDPVITLWYKLKYQYIYRNANFGKNTRIGCRLVIEGPGKVIVGDNCQILKDIWCDDNVVINTHKKDIKVIIEDDVILRGTKIGANLSIIISKGSVIERAFVIDSDFHNIDVTKRNSDFEMNDRPVVIGANCYLGYDSICSKGTTLFSNVILLAGSIIGNKNIKSALLLGGNPARRMVFNRIQPAAIQQVDSLKTVS